MFRLTLLTFFSFNIVHGAVCGSTDLHDSGGVRGTRRGKLSASFPSTAHLLESSQGEPRSEDVNCEHDTLEKDLDALRERNRIL